MGLIFVYGYQHHDTALLQPVANELGRRGHNLMGDPADYYAFLKSYGRKALLLVADLQTNGHVEGRAAVKLARQNGIKSMSIQHGCPAAFPNAGDPPTKTSADVYCLWGDFWKAHFDSPSQVVTGNPSLDNVRQNTMKDRVLLCPAFRPDAKHDVLASMDEEERADFYIVLARDIGYTGWIIRPHPSDWKYPERMKQYKRMVEMLDGELSKRPLEEDLSDSWLVAGTSTVLIEALAYGCEIRPILMDYLPEIIYDEILTYDLLYDLDGKAHERIADEVEQCLCA